jgi:hypothetical protein
VLTEELKTSLKNGQEVLLEGLQNSEHEPFLMLWYELMPVKEVW